MGYASDNEGGEKTAILDSAPDAARVEESSPSRGNATTKRMAAYIGVALAVVGALMALQSVTTAATDRSVNGAQQQPQQAQVQAHHQHHQHQQHQQQHLQQMPQVQPLTLASAQTGGSWWLTDHPVLASGLEFMIMCAVENKCVDDGNAQASGPTKHMYLLSCDKNNNNQRFVYDPSSNMIKTSTKGNVCWNDGGVNSGGITGRPCDANSNDFKFVYDWTTRTIRIPTKPGKCVAGGGSKFEQRNCDPGQANQVFEIVPAMYW